MLQRFLTTGLLLLGIAALVSGCGKSIRDWMHSFSDPDYRVTVLRESLTPSKEERWVSVWGMTHVDTIGGFVVRSDSESRDMQSQASNQQLPERIYYVYVLPRGSKYTWNIETDEPNYVYRWYNGEIGVLKQSEGIYRDENNKLRPADWQPPALRPKPWYVKLNPFRDPWPWIFIGGIVVAILIRGRIREYRLQRKQRPPASQNPSQ